MFSSSNGSSSSASPFQPYFPFSSSNFPPPPSPPPPPPPPSCTADIYLHHIHDPLSGQFPLNHATSSMELHPQPFPHLGISSNTIPPSINACGGDDNDHRYHNYFPTINNDNFPYFFHSSREDIFGPPAPKKDRHSKIFTAQGLRERRVRLSVNVARQFFDLQDQLGFDKASKTLEWLLKNSAKAIKHLGTRNKSSSFNSETSHSSDCNDVASEINEVENVMTSVMKEVKESESGVQGVGKESRAKARARARERTREKKICTSTSPSSSRRSQISSQLKRSDEEDLAVVVKRNKMKPLSLADQSSRNSHTDGQFANNGAQIWDINGGPPCPNINCGITNINLSTGIQMRSISKLGG